MLEKFFITCNEENHWTLDTSHVDDKIILLRDEYEKFWQKILRGENFALARHADGERSLMLGRKFKAQEGWSTGEGVTNLGKALRESLKVDAPNYFYGISCPCCDSEAYYWYLHNIKSSNLTFSNIWLNANFKTFMQNFSQLERDAVLITNWRGKGKTFGKLNVLRHYTISDQCVPFWEEEGKNLIRQIIAETGHEKNLLYVVSAGPISGVIIAELFKHNPDNCYVDFGSATDLMTHEKITRPYMIEGNPYAEQSCWMFDRKKIGIDVDVVLTCYKRPQILRQQLDAVKNQTLVPRRIFLCQDGIDGYYKIELNDKILSEFDACKISATNCGVWKRFEFAEEICKSPYVCIFDDDTIPGSRWLENCHMNMMQRRGVYVTNGVLLRTLEGYPRNHLNAGWYRPNKKTCAVDFGGHSWFMDRKCLSWMLAKPWCKKYKLVGEDMTLSFAAKEHGFGTYVPQHPEKILSLWGSLPHFGLKYGTNEVAISINPDNLNAMTRIVKEISAAGWKLLLAEKPAYVHEFLSVIGQSTVPTKENSLRLQTLKSGVKNLLPLLGRRPPIFLGERKHAQNIQRLFALRSENYYVMDNEKHEINLQKLFGSLRRGAIHIFFTDVYDRLKPVLEQSGLREGVDFMDGRGVLIAMMN